MALGLSTGTCAGVSFGMRAAVASLLLVAALASPAVADSSVVPAAQPAGGCERLPSGWRPDELARAALRDGANAKETLVLAWQIDEDDRPLLIHSALVWIALEGSGVVVANLYRHPRDRNEWRISAVYDVPYVGLQRYAKPPTRAELDRFFGETWWPFRARDGFRLLGAEVCTAAWRRATGRAPWRTYP